MLDAVMVNRQTRVCLRGVIRCLAHAFGLAHRPFISIAANEPSKNSRCSLTLYSAIAEA